MANSMEKLKKYNLYIILSSLRLYYDLMLEDFKRNSDKKKDNSFLRYINKEKEKPKNKDRDIDDSYSYNIRRYGRFNY